MKKRTAGCACLLIALLFALYFILRGYTPSKALLAGSEDAIPPVTSVVTPSDETHAAYKTGDASRRALHHPDFVKKVRFIRENPLDPKRAEMIDSLVDECIMADYESPDGAYILLEANKELQRKGEFSFALIRAALRHYEFPEPDHDAQIRILEDTIHTVETQDLDFGYFGTSLIVDSPEAKAAVIEELTDQIEKQKALKAGIDDSKPLLEPTREAFFPGDIITPPGLTGDRKARHDEACEALSSKDFDGAISLWESIGLKENAAAALMRSGGHDIDGQLGAVDRVVQRYPDTRQASMAGYKRAQIFHNAAKYQECLEECDKYAAAYPKSDLAASAYCEVGMSLYMSGSNADMAIEALEKGTTLQAEVHKQVYVPPILLNAASYEMKGDRKAANDVLRKYIAALRSGELSPTPTDGGESLAREAAIQALEERLLE